MSTMDVISKASRGLDVCNQALDWHVMRGVARLCVLFDRYVKLEWDFYGKVTLGSMRELIGPGSRFLQGASAWRQGVTCLHESINLVRLKNREWADVFEVIQKNSEAFYDGSLFFCMSGIMGSLFASTMSLSWLTSVGIQWGKLYYLSSDIRQMCYDLDAINLDPMEEIRIQDLLKSGSNNTYESGLNEKAFKIVKIINSYKQQLAGVTDLPIGLSCFRKVAEESVLGMGFADVDPSMIEDRSITEPCDMGSLELGVYLNPIRAYLKKRTTTCDTFRSLGGALTVAQSISRLACVALSVSGRKLTDNAFLAANIAQIIATLSFDIFRSLRKQEVIGSCMWGSRTLDS